MKNTSNTFLKFYDDKNGGTKLVSIDSILVSGYPIDEETGDDLEICGELLFDEKGEMIN